MTPREEKQRLKRKKKAIRKAMHILNIALFALVVVITIIGVFHTFTPKKTFRNKGVECFNKGEYEAAIENFDKALGYNQWFSDKLNVDICYYKADSYLRLEMYQEAYDTYSFMIDEYSDSHYSKEDVLYLMKITEALIKFSNGEYFASHTTFVEAVEIGYKELAVYAAICFEHLDDYDKMKEYFDIYSREVGMDAYLCYKFAQYYIEQEDYNTAVAYVNQGLSQEDKTYEKQHRYTQIVGNEKLGQFNEAFALAKEYKELYPDDTKGDDLYAYLDTRVNISEEPVNDIYNLFGDDYEDYVEEY